MTPEETVVEAAQRLTESATTNSKVAKSDQMVPLKQLAKVFEQIADKNSQEVAYKQLKKMASQPRVAVPQPGVGVTVQEQVKEPQFIVACTTEAVVNSMKRPIHNYISQYEE